MGSIAYKYLCHHSRGFDRNTAEVPVGARREQPEVHVSNIWLHHPTRADVDENI